MLIISSCFEVLYYVNAQEVSTTTIIPVMFEQIRLRFKSHENNLSNIIILVLCPILGTDVLLEKQGLNLKLSLLNAVTFSNVGH